MIVVMGAAPQRRPGAMLQAWLVIVTQALET